MAIVCHKRPTLRKAKEIIASGGAHQTMPVWGTVLTAQQLDALVDYTLSAAKGTPLEVGQKLFATNCAVCHGDFGEGGPNPARPGEIDRAHQHGRVPEDARRFHAAFHHRARPAQLWHVAVRIGLWRPAGRRPRSMRWSPIIRSWEQKPPVELPPEVATPAAARTGRWKSMQKYVRNATARKAKAA